MLPYFKKSENFAGAPSQAHGATGPLGVGRPTLLHDYPVSMAALARPSPADPRVAERVELYVCGLELANGFGELTAADVKYSIDRIADPKNQAPWAAKWAALDHVEVADAYSGTISYSSSGQMT